MLEAQTEQVTQGSTLLKYCFVWCCSVDYFRKNGSQYATVRCAQGEVRSVLREVAPPENEAWRRSDNAIWLRWCIRGDFFFAATFVVDFSVFTFYPFYFWRRLRLRQDYKSCYIVSMRPVQHFSSQLSRFILMQNSIFLGGNASKNCTEQTSKKVKLLKVRQMPSALRMRGTISSQQLVAVRNWD